MRTRAALTVIALLLASVSLGAQEWTCVVSQKVATYADGDWKVTLRCEPGTAKPVQGQTYTLSKPEPPPPPVVIDCAGTWSDWTAISAWTACDAGGQQTRTEQRLFTVTTPASNGGVACPVSPETRTVSQACTPPPPPPVSPVEFTASATTISAGQTVTLTLACVGSDDCHAITINGQPPTTWTNPEGPGFSGSIQLIPSVTATYTAQASRLVDPGPPAVLEAYVIPPVTVTVSGTPPPPDPPPPTGPFACGVTTQDYWNGLLGSGYTIHSYTLRDPAQLQFWPAGLVSSNGRNNWTYDAVEDAALLAIPEYASANCTLSAPLGASDGSMVVSVACGIDPGDHLRLDAESVKAVSLSADQRTITLQRGQRSTSAASHAAGTPVYGSSNSAGADIRLPSPAGGASFSPPLNKDGDTYLVIWDNKIDESYRVSRSGMTQDVYKHVQFWNPSHLSNPGGPSLRWLEHRIGFCDGCAGEQPPDFDPTPGSFHVAWLDFRCDPSVSTSAAWADQPGGKTLFGPNATVGVGGAACYDGPIKRHFIVETNVWFRRATEIMTQVNDYDLVSSWAKSEVRPLTPLLVNLHSSLRFEDGATDDTLRRMTLLQLEIDSSKQNLDGREVGSVLKQWFRNVWIGRNVPPAVRDQMLACQVRP